MNSVVPVTVFGQSVLIPVRLEWLGEQLLKVVKNEKVTLKTIDEYRIVVKAARLGFKHLTEQNSISPWESFRELRSIALKVSLWHPTFFAKHFKTLTYNNNKILNPATFLAVTPQFHSLAKQEKLYKQKSQAEHLLDQLFTETQTNKEQKNKEIEELYKKTIQWAQKNKIFEVNE